MSGADHPTWLGYLGELLGVSQDVPQWILASVSLAFTYLFVIFPSGAMMSFLDRKLTADLQARVGPNRAGPAGLLQPVADLLKLLQKEGASDWSWREALWLGVHTMALFSTVAVMPLGSFALLVDTDMSVFLPFWAALVLSFGTMLLGFSQGSVPGWFGGVRVAAQALAGAFPALIAVLCVGVHAGEFHWSALAGMQGALPHDWTAFASPFLFIAFAVFVISGLVLLGVPPMDAGISAPDIHGGVSSHLSGRRLSLFRFGRFYGFFFWSVISVVIFLGAWQLPFGLSERLREWGSFGTLLALELFWILMKTFALMLLVISVSRVTPKSRVDQITDFTWKVLSPFSIFALVGTGLWVGWKVLS